MVPARTWREGVHAVEIAPTERVLLRRQMAAAAGKKSATSLFMEAYGLEVEEELSTMAPILGQKGRGLANGTENKEKLG